MFEPTNELQLHALGEVPAAQYARQLIERLGAQLATSEAELKTEQAKLKFEQAKNQALNLEVMRLKQWRFGSSSESMDSTQAQLFDAKIEATLIEEFRIEVEVAPISRTLST